MASNGLVLSLIFSLEFIQTYATKFDLECPMEELNTETNRHIKFIMVRFLMSHSQIGAIESQEMEFQGTQKGEHFDKSMRLAIQILTEMNKKGAACSTV